MIRKIPIDEPPLLLNVLKGGMSILGPCHRLHDYDEEYDATLNRGFEIRPSITGVAQVGALNTIGWHQKLNFNMANFVKIGYIMYTTILLITFGVVLRFAGFRPSGEDVKFGEHK